MNRRSRTIGSGRRWPQSSTFPVLISIALLSALLACEGVITTPEPPSDDNPKDPENPEFVEPSCTITSPSDGSVINTDSVLVEWESPDSGILFQTRTNSEDWSSWSLNTSQTLEDLDERSYIFRVRAAFDSTDSRTIQSIPDSISFTVNAMQGPSLRLSPRFSEGSVSDVFTVGLIAEEVLSLMGVKAVILYDPNVVIVTEDIIKGTFFDSNGGTQLLHTEVDNVLGRVEINLSVVGGTPEGVNGTGILVNIPFTGQGAGDASLTFDLSNTLLRDPDNQTITPLYLRAAVIRVR